MSVSGIVPKAAPWGRGVIINDPVRDSSPGVAIRWDNAPSDFQAVSTTWLV